MIYQYNVHTLLYLDSFCVDSCAPCIMAVKERCVGGCAGWEYVPIMQRPIRPGTLTHVKQSIPVVYAVLFTPRLPVFI